MQVASDSMVDPVSVAMMAAAAFVFVLLQLVPAWYGRYADSAPKWLGCLGWLVPGPRACWVVQEVPNVVMWALMFWWLPGASGTHANTGVNVLLSSYFLLHYLHRCVQWRSVRGCAMSWCRACVLQRMPRPWPWSWDLGTLRP